jgi:transposase
MLGPRAVALATELNKEPGLSPQKTAEALARFGIQITPGGVVQAIARQARVLEPTYEAVVEGVRSSRAVAPDETGWRINGQKAWLWAFAGEDLTVYLIARGRGCEQAVEILGEKFSGVLERDGWAPYRRFANARHQTCAAHLLRRTGELIADSVAGQARVRHATRRILKDALASRDRRDAIDADEFGLNVVELEQRTDELLRMRPTHEPNRRLPGHLANEREHMFTFLAELRRPSDELAGRAGAQTRDREPQELGRKPHLARRARPADHDERDLHRPPTRHRSGRADGLSPALARAGREQPDPAPGPRLPGQPGSLRGDARTD